MLVTLARAMTESKKSDTMTESGIRFDSAWRESGSLSATAQRLMSEGESPAAVGYELLTERLQRPMPETERALNAATPSVRENTRIAIMMQRAGLSTRWYKAISAVSRAISTRQANLKDYDRQEDPEGAACMEMELVDLESLVRVAIEQQGFKGVLRSEYPESGATVMWSPELLARVAGAGARNLQEYEERRKTTQTPEEAAEPFIDVERNATVSLSDLISARTVARHEGARRRQGRQSLS